MISDEQRDRLGTLYRIIDMHGENIPFDMTAHQKQMCSAITGRDIWFSSRQVGIDTFVTILFLDECIHLGTDALYITTSNLQSEHLMRTVIASIKDFTENEVIDVVRFDRFAITLRNNITDRKARLRFSVSVPSGAVSNLYASCIDRYSYMKTEEVVTGAFNAVPNGRGKIIASLHGFQAHPRIADMIDNPEKFGFKVTSFVSIKR